MNNHSFGELIFVQTNVTNYFNIELGWWFWVFDISKSIQKQGSNTKTPINI
jgi:hypothetical protein